MKSSHAARGQHGSEVDDSDAADKVSISTLTADGHTQLAKLFRKNIRDKNFWEIIRTIKKRIDDVELVREGFIAIGDLAFESQLSQKVLGEVGACGTVIYGMKLHAMHLGIAFTGLTAVTALLLNGNTENVVRMTQAGGCEVVIDVLNRHLECAYVALGGALAVHRLAEGHPDNAVALGASSAGGLIIRVMRQVRLLRFALSLSPSLVHTIMLTFSIANPPPPPHTHTHTHTNTHKHTHTHTHPPYSTWTSKTWCWLASRCALSSPYLGPI